MVTMTAVIVSGARGDVLFTGFSWGYGGTGPHGLCTLFHFLGMDQKAAMEASMEKIPWLDEPGEDDFARHGEFICRWMFQPEPMTMTLFAGGKATDVWNVPRRKTTMRREVTDHGGNAFGIVIDQILHRRLPGLNSRRALARVIGCDPSYLSFLISGEKPLTQAFGIKASKKLSAIPGMLVEDLSFLRKISADQEHARRAERTKEKEKRKGPSIAQLQDIIAHMEGEIAFLESTDQPSVEPLSDRFTPIAVAMVAAALRLDLCILAQTRHGYVVSAMLDHPPISLAEPHWYVEVTGDGDPSSSNDQVCHDPTAAAARFVELVGSWAAMNAVRSALLE
jgi:hypothetical protein